MNCCRLAAMPRPTSSTPSADQLPLPLFSPSVVIPQGDGSYLVRPGKPVEWLTVKQFAAAVGLHRNTIYDYVGTAFLPDSMVQQIGCHKLRIRGEAVAHFLDAGRRLRDGV